MLCANDTEMKEKTEAKQVLEEIINSTNENNLFDSDHRNRKANLPSYGRITVKPKKIGNISGMEFIMIVEVRTMR